jgi:phosphosulfolactate synthase
MSGFLSVPVRSIKPRDIGISHVIDKGLGIRQLEDLLDTASDYIDILKLGWGTAYVTQNLFDKIKLCHEAKVPVCFGGTFLELAILQGRFDEYRNTARKAGLTHVEISNGVIDMSRREKAKYIRELAKDFTVLSEVGSKDSEKIIPPYRWVELIEADLEAGAWKVICEARESGTVGLYFGTGEVRSGLIDEITEKIDPADLIFEAPQKAQQVWLVKKFGSEVSVGNVATNEVIALETLRLGLRADTMPLFHDVNGWNARTEEHRDPEPARPKRRSQA